MPAYLYNVLLSRLLSEYKIIVFHFPRKKQPFVLVGIQTLKLIVSIISFYFLQILLHMLDVAAYLPAFLILFYVALHLEVCSHAPRHIWEDMHTAWAMLSPLSTYRKVFLTVLEYYLYFVYTSSDKLFAIIAFLSLSDIKLTVAVILSVNYATFSWLIYKTSTNAKASRLATNFWFKVRHVLWNFLLITVGIIFIYYLLSFLITGFSILRMGITSKGLNPHSLDLVNSRLLVEWTNDFSTISLTIEKISVWFANSAHLVLLFVVVFIVFSVSGILGINYVKYYLDLPDTAYINSLNKRTLVGLWRFLYKHSPFVDDVLLSTQITLLENDRRVAETKIGIFSLDTSCIPFFAALIIFLLHMQSPFLKLFLITFITIVLELNVSQNIQKSLTLYFNFNNDSPVLDYYKSSTTRISSLAKTKVHLLMILSLPPIFIISCISSVICIVFLPSVFAVIFTLILSPLVVVWSDLCGSTLSSFMILYVLGLKLNKFSRNDSLDEIEGFEDKVSLHFYIIWKNILILPWYYLFIANGIFPFLDTHLLYVAIGLFCLELMVFPLLIAREQSTLFAKGAELFEKSV